MNIAFSAIVLAVLLLPGGLFRFGYLRGYFRRSPIVVANLIDDLPWVLFGAIIIQAMGQMIVHLLGRPSDYHVVLPLMLGQYGDKQDLLKNIIETIPNLQFGYFLYFVVINLFAYIIGLFFHWLVRTNRWDNTYNFLRFPNEWYYMLDPEPNRKQNNLPVVWLSTVVDHKEASYLYRGIVSDWQLDRIGGLEKVELANAMRRTLKDDRPIEELHKPQGDGRYYKIEGMRFMIRYADMKTVNLFYAFPFSSDEYEVVPQNATDPNP